MSEATYEETYGGSEFVEVYAKATGRKQSVPRHFLDDPVLSAGIRRTPLSEKQQAEADALIAAANPEGDPVVA